MLKAHEYAKNNNLNAYFGTVLSSDEFYRKWENGVIENLIKYQTLGIEMEAAGLYMSALENGKQALCICTVSDNSEGEDSAEVRERAYTEMMEMALEIA